MTQIGGQFVKLDESMVKLVMKIKNFLMKRPKVGV